MLVAIAIAVATITSGVCYGPIDQIFTGVRDTTNCSNNSHSFSCFFCGNPLTNHTRDGGAVLLLFLLFFVLLVYKVSNWIILIIQRSKN